MSFLEKFGMRPGPDKKNFVVSAQFIDKEEIAADMAFSAMRQFTTKRMIVVLGWKRSIVCDDQQHRRFEAWEIEAA